MKNKMTALVLALILAFSLCVPAYASFSDLEGHWAKAYMEDLADRGYLSGYGNGTIRPNSDITACETLALVSRFYSADSTAVALIDAEFGAYVAQTVASSYSWAYDELALCLAAGIVTKTELKSMSLSTAIEKQRLSVFLVRALQLQEQAAALSGTGLTFGDVDKITADCLGSVAELAALGIVQGDDDGNFTPKLGVTRAVTATMISRSLDYLETAGLTLRVKGYEDILETEGIVTAASSGSLELCGFDGLTRYYDVPVSASVTVNGTRKTLTADCVGSRAAVTTDEGTTTVVTIESEDKVAWVQGTAAGAVASGSQRYLYVKPVGGSASARYTLSADAEVTLNGAAAAFSSLTDGSFITMKLKDGTAMQVNAVTADYELTGKLSSIVYGSIVSLHMTGGDGAVYSFGLNISSLPDIYRGGTKISIDRLGTGWTITVTVKGGAVTSIAAKDTGDTVTGTLYSITYTAAGTQWIVTKGDGTSLTLTVDENAGVYSGTTPILLSDIRAGDTVSLEVYGGTVSEVHLISSANPTTKVTGTVLAVDTAARTITLLNASGKLIYIDASSAASIIDAATGQTLRLSALEADMTLVAYGTYSSSSAFTAASIIIEG